MKITIQGSPKEIAALERELKNGKVPVKYVANSAVVLPSNLQKDLRSSLKTMLIH